jgi:anti-sigma factor RsiW
MTRKAIPLTFATIGAALAFAAPAGAAGSRIPECLDSQALCQQVGVEQAGQPQGPNARPKIKPTVNADGTWRAGDRIMY